MGSVFIVREARLGRMGHSASLLYEWDPRGCPGGVCTVLGEDPPQVVLLVPDAMAEEPPGLRGHQTDCSLGQGIEESAGVQSHPQP